jgi:hypothetical protein
MKITGSHGEPWSGTVITSGSSTHLFSIVQNINTGRGERPCSLLCARWLKNDDKEKKKASQSMLFIDVLMI